MLTPAGKRFRSSRFHGRCRGEIWSPSFSSSSFIPSLLASCTRRTVVDIVIFVVGVLFLTDWRMHCSNHEISEITQTSITRFRSLRTAEVSCDCKWTSLVVWLYWFRSVNFTTSVCNPPSHLPTFGRPPCVYFVCDVFYSDFQPKDLPHTHAKESRRRLIVKISNDFCLVFFVFMLFLAPVGCFVCWVLSSCVDWIVGNLVEEWDIHAKCEKIWNFHGSAQNFQ